MNNVYKKISYLLLTILITFGIMCQVGISPHLVADAKTKSMDSFIYSPTLLTASGDVVYLYDDYLHQIKAYDTASKQNISNLDINDIIFMKFVNKFLFVITKSNNTIYLSRYTLENRNFILRETTDILSHFTSIDSAYIGIMATDIAYIDNSYVMFVVYNRDNNPSLSPDPLPKGICKFILNYESGTNITSSKYTPNPTNLNTLDYSAFVSNDWKQIYVINVSEIYIISERNIYRTTKVTQGTDNVYYVSVIYTNDTNIKRVAITKNNNLIFEQNSESHPICTLINISDVYTKHEIDMDIEIFDDICSFGNNIYYTLDTDACKVQNFELNESETAINGNVIDIVGNLMVEIINLPNSANLQIKITKANTFMYANPYDMQEMLSIPQGSRVAVLCAEDTEKFINYTYIMYTTDTGTETKNNYGYVETAALTEYAMTSCNEDITANANAKIYRYPSLVNDSKNTLVTSPFGKKTKITKIAEENCAIYDTTTNVKMYKVALPQGTIGYISATEVAPYVPDIKELISTNAKITKEVIVYEDETGTSPTAITLTKGYRVYVPTRIEYNRRYTLVRFNDANGDEIQGYVLTSSLHKDGLTTLQIVGIVLLTVNVTFLMILIIVKRKIVKD